MEETHKEFFRDLNTKPQTPNKLDIGTMPKTTWIFYKHQLKNTFMKKDKLPLEALLNELGAGDEALTNASDDFNLPANGFAQFQMAYKFGQLRRSAHAIFDCVYEGGINPKISEVHLAENVRAKTTGYPPATTKTRPLFGSPLLDAARSTTDLFEISGKQEAAAPKLKGNLVLVIDNNFEVHLKIAAFKTYFALSIQVQSPPTVPVTFHFYTRTEDNLGFTTFDEFSETDDQGGIISPDSKLRAGELAIVIKAVGVADEKIIFLNLSN